MSNFTIFKYHKTGIFFILLLSLFYTAWTVKKQEQTNVQTDEKRLNKEVTVVFILDGLRPDLIQADITPNLFKLRQRGITFTHSHAAFPTSTRINAATISTGTYPGTSGLVGNSLYVPGVDSSKSFTTGDYENLLTLRSINGGDLLFVKTLSEYLHEHNKKLVAISSGSTGSAFLLNPKATRGIGALINGSFGENRVAYPDKVNQEILEKFGAVPPKEGEIYNAIVDWTERVLAEYVISELQPDVVLNWLTEPDHTQHQFGTGSKRVIEALKNDDRNIGMVLKKMHEYYEGVNIFVTADHGFSLYSNAYNLKAQLVDAGFKQSETSSDVVFAANGIYVNRGGEKRIKEIVTFLQQKDWIDAIFTAPKNEKEGSCRGWVKGTFSLTFIGLYNEKQGPDIVYTYKWSSDKNPFGFPGKIMTGTDGDPGEVEGNRSGHGGLSPWLVRTAFLASGPAFKDSITIRNPVSNIDIAPTIVHILGLAKPEYMQGRILKEALIDEKTDYEKLPSETQIYSVQSAENQFKSLLQISTVNGHRYLDKAWRVE